MYYQQHDLAQLYDHQKSIYQLLRLASHQEILTYVAWYLPANYTSQKQIRVLEANGSAYRLQTEKISRCIG